MWIAILLLQMPFSRVIREIAQSLCSTKDLRFQSTAIMCLQVQQQILSAANDEKLWIVNKFTGSCWSFLGDPVWGQCSLCHPCQEGHPNAQVYNFLLCLILHWDFFSWQIISGTWTWPAGSGDARNTAFEMSLWIVIVDTIYLSYASAWITLLPTMCTTA